MCGPGKYKVLCKVQGLVQNTRSCAKYKVIQGLVQNTRSCAKYKVLCKIKGLVQNTRSCAKHKVLCKTQGLGQSTRSWAKYKVLGKIQGLGEDGDIFQYTSYHFFAMIKIFNGVGHLGHVDAMECGRSKSPLK